MFIRTERLFLRPGWIEDTEELTAAIGRQEVVRMLARVPWPYRREHAELFLQMDRNPELPRFLITLPAERGRIVGGIGLHQGEGTVELGYWIAPEYWGRGIATEAVKGLTASAHTLGHRRLVSRHAVDNPASGRVLRKAGFQLTGRRASHFSNGRGGEVETIEYARELDEPAMNRKRTGKVWTEARTYQRQIDAAA